MMVRYHNRLLSQAVSTDDGNKYAVNAQLARSMDRADVQLTAIQVISNDNLNLNEETSMLLPTQHRPNRRQQPTQQTFLQLLAGS